MLFNGFQPLFQALNPQQVNDLSLNLVQVLQGEGGTVAGLLQKTASLTNTLADRDQLIGEVITNLGQTLETVDERHEQLSDLIVELKGWMTDLARDRDTIGDSLSNISDLTEVVADLVSRSRPLVKADVAKLRELAHLLNEPENRKTVIEHARPAARVDDRPDPDRHLRLLVQLLPLRVLRRHHAARARAASPASRSSRKQLSNLRFHSTAPRCQ